MLNLQKAPTILVPYEMGYALRNLHFLHLSRINKIQTIQTSVVTSLIVADKKRIKTSKKLDLVHKIDLVLKVYGMKWMNN